MANCIIQRAGGAGVDCDDATATVAQVLTPYTFGGSASDEVQTGTMANCGTAIYTINTNGGVVSINQGYHSGSGKVTYLLPSVAGGTTITPTASAQTVSLANKYLRSNISVAGSSNLVSKNILSGKTIWNVPGTFVNYANVHTVYNGSSYAGFLTGGFLDAPTGGGTALDTAYGGHWNDKTGNNGAITGGSLYARNTSGIISSSRFCRIISSRSVNFNLFSTLRIVGRFDISATILGTRTTSMYVTVQPREWTNVSGTTSMVSALSQTTNMWSATGTSSGANAVSGTIPFDLSFNIGSWTASNGFLDIGVKSNPPSSSSGVTWGSMTVHITAIYLL